ncbi:MAG: BCCT family transporter [Candidatus Eremiobacteraeota bacterium]|nr:BCCT family transporter [Candidatus Eremiobacteraeota bacterium]
MKQDEKIDTFEAEVKKTYRRESDQEQIDAWVQEFKGAMEQRFADDEARDQEEIREEERKNINFNLVLSLTITLAFLVISFIYRNSMMEISSLVKSYITKNFGWFFVILSTGAVIYLAYLAFSRFGDVVLGDPKERPEFGDISWYSMLFSAGMGVGILFWGAAEPLTHYLNNPVHDSQTTEAARAAMAITMLHWGVHGWGVYTLCAVAVAYYGFRKRKSYLVSSSLTGLSPIKALDRPLAVIVDLTATIAIVFGLAASLAMGTFQMASGLEKTFGLAANQPMGYAAILAVITVCFVASATTGLKKGIKILSNLNMLTCVSLLAFVFVAGPSLFDIKLFIDTIGGYISNLPSMAFQVAPFTPEYERWMADWTITYFTWWIAWAPFVGIFIARISRGRTIKELVLGSLLVPVIFTAFWFSVFGGAALTLVINGDTQFVALINSAKYPDALFYLLECLPFTQLTSIVSICLIFTFLVTSADSACFVLAMMTSEGDLDPKMSLKLLWAAVMATLTGFLVKDGDLGPIQAAAQLCAGPFALVLLLMAVSLPVRLRHQVRQRRI